MSTSKSSFGAYADAALPQVEYRPMGFFREIGRMFILIGAIFVAIGALLYFGAKLPFRLGQLPGDIVHRTKNGLFYFPIVSCILVSAIITLVAWLMSLIRK